MVPQKVSLWCVGSGPDSQLCLMHTKVIQDIEVQLYIAKHKEKL